jgi:hypothetical protein
MTHDLAFFVVSTALLGSRFQIQFSHSDFSSVLCITVSSLRSCCSAEHRHSLSLSPSFSLPLRLWSHSSNPFYCRQFFCALDPFGVLLSKPGLLFLLQVFDFHVLVLIQPPGHLLFFRVACCRRRGVSVFFCSLTSDCGSQVNLLIFVRSRSCS